MTHTTPADEGVARVPADDDREAHVEDDRSGHVARRIARRRGRAVELPHRRAIAGDDVRRRHEDGLLQQDRGQQEDGLVPALEQHDEERPTRAKIAGMSVYASASPAPICARWFTVCVRWSANHSAAFRSSLTEWTVTQHVHDRGADGDRDHGQHRVHRSESLQIGPSVREVSPAGSSPRSIAAPEGYERALLRVVPLRGHWLPFRGIRTPWGLRSHRHRALHTVSRFIPSRSTRHRTRGTAPPSPPRCAPTTTF